MKGSISIASSSHGTEHDISVGFLAVRGDDGVEQSLEVFKNLAAIHDLVSEGVELIRLD